MAVWSNGNAIQSALRPSASGVWGAATDVFVGSHNAFKPEVAVDRQGDAVAVWQTTEPNQVEGAFHSAGGVWGAPIQLSGGVERAEEPQIAFDPDGNAIAIWRAANGEDKTIESSVRPAGGTWQQPVVVSLSRQLGANNASESLQLAVDEQGEATTAWSHSNVTSRGESTSVIESAVRDADGVWQAPVAISASDKEASGVRLAVNPGGAAVAAWGCAIDGHFPGMVQAAVRPAGSGTWQAPVYLSGTNVGRLRVAIDSQVSRLDMYGSAV